MVTVYNSVNQGMIFMTVHYTLSNEAIEREPSNMNSVIKIPYKIENFKSFGFTNHENIEKYLKSP